MVYTVPNPRGAAPRVLPYKPYSSPTAWMYAYFESIFYLRARVLWKLTDLYKSTHHYLSILFDPCCDWFTTRRTPNLALVRNGTQNGPCSGQFFEVVWSNAKTLKFGLIATLADQDSFIYVYRYFTAVSLPGTRQLTTVSFFFLLVNTYIATVISAEMPLQWYPFHGQKELTYLEREVVFGAGGPSWCRPWSFHGVFLNDV